MNLFNSYQKEVLYFILVIPFTLFLVNVNNCFSNPFNQYSDVNKNIKLNETFLVLEDTSNLLGIQEILQSEEFQKKNTNILNLGLSNSTFWIKFYIKNNTEEEKLLIEIGNGYIDLTELFYIEGNQIRTQSLGRTYKFNNRKYKVPSLIFDLPIKPGEAKVFFLKIKSKGQIFLPITIGSRISQFHHLKNKDIIMAIYFGSIMIMIIYNLFIFFSIKDKSYLFYVGYISFIMLSVLNIHGYLFQYFWPDHPWVNNYIYTILPSLCGILAVYFMTSFLQTKIFAPRKHKLFKYNIWFFIIVIILSLFNFYNFSITAMRINLLAGSFLAIYTGFELFKKGHKPANFFLIGWSTFLFSLIAFELTEIGIIPSTKFTTYYLIFGSIVEAVFLSFALANRINVLQEDNKQKQEEIIKHLRDNEKYLVAWQEASVNAEKLKKESLVSQYESLKNQVNPHFLFNSLNVLTELLYQNQDQAAIFIKELANVYRYLLENRNKELVELQQELDFINAFVFLLKIRFDTNLNVNVDLPENSDILIAPLTLQLLIENAIKHNVISEEAPLFVRVFLDGDFIIVENNLQQKNIVERSSKVGLKNIIERYTYLTDHKLDITVNEEKFIVSVPIIKDSQEIPILNYN